MNSECFYCASSEAEARRIIAEIRDQEVDLSPVSISVATAGFIADFDLNGEDVHGLRIREGQIMVFVYGKTHLMGQIAKLCGIRYWGFATEDSEGKIRDIVKVAE